MLIVAGHLIVDQRDAYLESCAPVVERARNTDGCLDYALTPDLLDPARVDVYERWSSRAALEAFRGSGPTGEQRAAIRHAEVAEYDVTPAPRAPSPTELPDDVRALLDGPNTAHVATLMEDGAPHSVPLWIGVEGDKIAFLSSPDSVKGRNLRRDPRVSISITEEGKPNVMAQVRGRVTEILDGDAGWAVIDRISHKYIGAPYPLRTDRVAFLVEPERAWARTF